MQNVIQYVSPLGDITIAADTLGLTGLWFEGQKYFGLSLEKAYEKQQTPVLTQAKDWLDRYFSGHDPGALPPLHLIGTPFQTEVWEILAAIPYGTTRTYRDIAAELAQRRGIRQMSAQAVGNAVARNNISIIVPCHRVVGRNGNLTGYAGGICKKIALLKLEGAYQDSFFLPKRSTAP